MDPPEGGPAWWTSQVMRQGKGGSFFGTVCGYPDPVRMERHEEQTLFPKFPSLPRLGKNNHKMGEAQGGPCGDGA